MKCCNLLQLLSFELVLEDSSVNFSVAEEFSAKTSVTQNEPVHTFSTPQLSSLHKLPTGVLI